MSDRQIPMQPAELLPMQPSEQPQQQDSYGTAVPQKPKKSRTGLTVALCVACVLLASALAWIWFSHLRFEFIDGRLLLRPEQQQTTAETEPCDRELQPNSDAKSDTQRQESFSVDKTLRLGEGQLSEAGRSMQEVYAAVSPSVVCVTAEGFDGSRTGTGIIISKDGFILTGSETVSSAAQITIIFSDGSTQTAELIGIERTSGLALVHCQSEGLTAASFADTAALQVGDALFCIGNPYGEQLRNVLSEGILSAMGSVELAGQELMLLNTSASFGAGNSGCPILDSAGNVVAVTSTVDLPLPTTQAAPDFAVSAADVQHIVQTIIANAAGDSRWLGFEVAEIPPSYRYYYGFPGSLWIRKVGAGSYADGVLFAYDVILSVDGVSVSTEEDYAAALAAHEIGDRIELRIFRGGWYYRIKLPLTGEP